MTCHMTKGSLNLDVITHPWALDEEFEKVWHLFSIVRTCNTQKEIDYVYKIYKKDEDILSLKDKNLKAEAKIEALEMLLDAHKDLIDKLKEIVNLKSL